MQSQLFLTETPDPVGRFLASFRFFCQPHSIQAPQLTALWPIPLLHQCLPPAKADTRTQMVSWAVSPWGPMTQSSGWVLTAATVKAGAPKNHGVRVKRCRRRSRGASRKCGNGWRTNESSASKGANRVPHDGGCRISTPVRFGEGPFGFFGRVRSGSCGFGLVR